MILPRCKTLSYKKKNHKKKKKKKNLTFLNLILGTIFIYIWKLLKLIEKAFKLLKLSGDDVLYYQ